MTKRTLMAVGVALLVAAVVVSGVLAQPGGGRGGPPGGGRGQGGPGGGPGGGMGMMMGPVTGTVTGGGVEEGSITVSVQMPWGGQAQDVTVQLGEGATLLKAEDAALGDLAEGNGLMVNGVPTALLANRLVTGANSVPVAKAMTNLGGGMGMGMGRMGGRRGGAASSPVPPTTAQAAGMIVSVDPLKVKISDTLTVEITPKDDATFTKIVQVGWDELTDGVTVQCSGEPTQEGEVVADTITIVPAQQEGR